MTTWQSFHWWFAIFNLTVWFPINQGLSLIAIATKSIEVPLTTPNQYNSPSYRKVKDTFFTRKSLANFYQLMKLSNVGKSDMKANERFTKNIVTNVEVCYDRFKRCSSELSPAFCGGFGQNVSFYIWARQWADYLLQQSGSHRNVKCSQGLLKIFATTFYRTSFRNIN